MNFHSQRPDRCLLYSDLYQQFNITYHTALSIVPPKSHDVCFIYIKSFNFSTITKLKIIFILKMKKQV